MNFGYRISTVVGGVITSMALSPLSVRAGEMPAAAASCIQCHGQDGIGTNDSYPNLAGQKKEYLLKQLRDFKSGARRDKEMNLVMKLLSEESMETVSAFFSSLERK